MLHFCLRLFGQSRTHCVIDGSTVDLLCEMVMTVMMIALFLFQTVCNLIIYSARECPV